MIIPIQRNRPIRTRREQIWRLIMNNHSAETQPTYDRRIIFFKKVPKNKFLRELHVPRRPLPKLFKKRQRRRFSRLVAICIRVGY